MSFFNADDKYRYLGLLIALVFGSVWVGLFRARVDALERDVKGIVEAVKYLSDSMVVRAK